MYIVVKYLSPLSGGRLVHLLWMAKPVNATFMSPLLSYIIYCKYSTILGVLLLQHIVVLCCWPRLLGKWGCKMVTQWKLTTASQWRWVPGMSRGFHFWHSQPLDRFTPPWLENQHPPAISLHANGARHLSHWFISGKIKGGRDGVKEWSKS